MQIVRATQDLEADTELVFAYSTGHEYLLYGDTQKALSSWGFTCDCKFCDDKKATSTETMQRPIILDTDLYSAICGPVWQLTRIRTLIEQLRESSPSDSQGVPRLELWHVYLNLGSCMIRHGRHAEAIKWIVMALEALGYGITACPPRKGPKEPALKITQWGQGSHVVLGGFVRLAKAYEAVCPQLEVVAKQYAEPFHSILYGEKETFSSVYANY